MTVQSHSRRRRKPTGYQIVNSPGGESVTLLTHETHLERQWDSNFYPKIKTSSQWAYRIGQLVRSALIKEMRCNLMEGKLVDSKPILTLLLLISCPNFQCFNTSISTSWLLKIAIALVTWENYGVNIPTPWIIHIRKRIGNALSWVLIRTFLSCTVIEKFSLVPLMGLNSAPQNLERLSFLSDGLVTHHTQLYNVSTNHYWYLTQVIHSEFLVRRQSPPSQQHPSQICRIRVSHTSLPRFPLKWYSVQYTRPKGGDETRLCELAPVARCSQDSESSNLGSTL